MGSINFGESKISVCWPLMAWKGNRSLCIMKNTSPVVFNLNICIWNNVCHVKCQIFDKLFQTHFFCVGFTFQQWREKESQDFSCVLHFLRFWFATFLAAYISKQVRKYCAVKDYTTQVIFAAGIKRERWETQPIRQQLANAYVKCRGKHVSM